MPAEAVAGDQMVKQGLAALGLEPYPEKTWVGKAEQGGKWLLPLTLTSTLTSYGIGQPGDYPMCRPV